MYFLLPLFTIINYNMLASGWLLDSMTDKVFSQLSCRENWFLRGTWALFINVVYCWVCDFCYCNILVTDKNKKWLDLTWFNIVNLNNKNLRNLWFYGKCLQHSLSSSAIKKKFLRMRPSNRIATYKSCNTAINFFRPIFESLLFSAGVVKLCILFWLLKSTAFSYCISKHVFGLQLVYSYQFNYRYVNKRNPIFLTPTRS